MAVYGRNIVVVGTSAGGLEALDRLVGALPTDLPASIFIVQHLALQNSGEPLLRRLNRHKAFRPKLARDGDRYQPGHIYVAPPDHHLLVKKSHIRVTKGARENRQRPAIDPLFRSAAVAHGSRVIGVNGLGDQVPYNCPGCGGVLWEMDTPGEKRYRCHTGHSYTGPTLLASQSEKIEEMLWIALRMFEERKNLLVSMTKAARSGAVRRSRSQRAKETQGYIDRIRGLLTEPGSDGPGDTLTQVKALMAEPRKAKSTR
jgi:hypothetical protein